MTNQQSTIIDRRSLSGEHLCVGIGSEEYAIPTSQVMGVLETPAVRRVPKAPDFIEGVANIRGRIVPLLNPIERFGLSDQSTIDNQQSSIQKQSTIDNHQSSIQKPLVLVRMENALYGLMIDRVASIRDFPQNIIEPVNPVLVSKEAPFIRGMANDGERIIHLLDLNAFISAGLEIHREERVAYEAFATETTAAGARARRRTSEPYLALRIAEETYAVHLSGLNEVIPTAKMEPYAGGLPYLAGTIKTREGILPVIDLQKKFNLDRVQYAESSRVVTLTAEGFYLGILANAVTEILDIDDEEIKEAPALISSGDAAHIKDIALLEGGARLVLLMDQTRILDDKEVVTLKKMDGIKMSRALRKKKPLKAEETLTFIIFQVAQMEFALNLNDLSEVIPYRAPTRIPKAPPHVKGLVPVKGELVSVIDLRRRFDLPAAPDAPETRIILVRQGNALHGVAADAVLEILRVAPKDVVAPPKIVKGIDSAFVERLLVIRKTDRAPIVLNMEAVLKMPPQKTRPKAAEASPRKRRSKKK